MTTPRPLGPTETTDTEIANRINNALIVKGTNARALSDATGIAYETLRRSLKGGRSLTFREFDKIATAINVKPAALLPASMTKDAA
jgi:lambda repressor-like predicted transcriptional regulator